MDELTRKPRKKDQLVHTRDWDAPRTWHPLGTVSHCDGNICWYEKPDGIADSFIWFFQRDNRRNRLVRIACRKCGEPLTGHEDESGTHCRWCVTCGDPVATTKGRAT